MAALALIMLVAGAAIRPVGEFPLNDDWAYALPVKWLNETGRLAFTDWQSMTLIGQVYLAAALTSLTGFSLTALRLLVMTLGAASVLLVFATSRTLGGERTSAALAATVFMANPILLTTSASFMTDVPFLFFCLLSIWFFVTYQARSATGWLLAAWVAVVIACSIRQLGVAIAAGFIGAQIATHGVNRVLFWRTVLPALLVLAAVVVYPHILRATIGLPSLYDGATDQLRNAVKSILRLELGYWRVALKKAWVIALYAGVCLAPWLAITFGRAHQEQSRFAWRPWQMVAAAAIISVIMHFMHMRMPLAHNTLVDFGLGARSLPGSAALPGVSPAFWMMITTLAVLAVLAGLAGFATALAPATRRAEPWTDKRRAGLWMLGTIMVFYNLPLLFLSQLWFDRYILLNAALLSIWLSLAVRDPWSSISRHAAVAFATLVYFAFGVMGTHDYLAWNRQRWSAAAYAEETLGASPAQIDGEFEYNNYTARLTGNVSRPPGAITIEKPGAPYRIALSALPEHRIVKRFPTGAWLPTSPTEVLLLENAPRQ